MPMDQQAASPNALLLMGSHCPHCPAVLQNLRELVKDGALDSLEVVNVEDEPEIAQQFGARSVPWVQIGPFELEGLRSKTEFRMWAQRAGTEQGMADYFVELLLDGRMSQVSKILRQDHAHVQAIIRLLADSETELSVRIGIGAVMEDLEGETALQSMVNSLGELIKYPDERIRSDACYYLGLSRHRLAVPLVKLLLVDPSEDVRELARDSLELLENPVDQLH